MKASRLLRITSIITLLFAVGHTLGGQQSWSPAGDTEVLRAMKSFSFDVEGVRRTYFDFYLGFGFTVSVFLLLQAVLLWQLAMIAQLDSRRVRPLILSFFLACVASALVSWKFIFVLPVICFAAIAAALGVAYFAANRGEDSEPAVVATHGRPGN